MTSAQFTLLRHGKVDGQPALYGHTDVALSEQGQRDLTCAITRIHNQSPVNKIFSSPLLRCAAVAQAFATEYQLPLQFEPQFKEMYFGNWDGVAFDKLGDSWQQLEAFWQSPASVAPPQGETLECFAQRVIRTWENLVSGNIDQHHLVVCHGGVIRIILAHILQTDWRNPHWFTQLHIDYCSSTRIEIAHQRAQVKWIGLGQPPR